ncbi:MAG: O-antigen ligase family protein [Bacteroidales bacterium]|nr:O-antigen ligase family protein [Bacteroidales bacterium]
MAERFKLIWIYGISLFFIAINLYLIVAKDFYWSALLPVFIIIIIMYFISLDKILLLITFLIPLAINIRNFEMGAALSLPTEPLLIGVLIFFIIKLFFDIRYEQRILKHPITIAIFFNLIWLLFTTVTSEIPMVSVKYFISRLWFVIPFFFVALLMFKEFRNIKLFIWLYCISFTIVILYSLIKHAGYGFDEDSGHWVMTPFYNDHTAYGAMLAFFIPILGGFGLMKEHSFGTRLIAWTLTGLFIIALILSYSRAAWVSLAAAILLLPIILLRIKFRWVFLTIIIIFSLFFSFQQQILDQLERNKQDSSANFVEHVQSIANITSDASNLERINRWQSALRMFNERPFWGFGPGTYQFLYAPYQLSKERTIISTNAGDLGNAHSEYIGPLAESGILGMISILIIAITSITIGLRLYKNAKSPTIKILSLSLVLSLFSYFMHGFLNNFLDTDKASVPFWGIMAIIVALDLYHNNKNPQET